MHRSGYQPMCLSCLELYWAGYLTEVQIMIETIETGAPNVVGLKLCGKLHDEDYKQFVPH